MLQYLSCLVYDDINCIEMRTIVMNEKVLQTLEYNKIIEQLVTYASSPSGREACRMLKPQTDSRWIETAQRETSDALTHILTKGELSFYGIEDIRPALKRLEIGSSLGSHELLDIAKLLSAAGSVKNYFRQSLREDDSTGDSLDERYRLIEPLSLLMQEIRRCIPDEDNIADDASTGLAQIRRQLKLTNDRIHEQLSSIVNGSARSMLQDSIITMRNGRYCLPVKAEYRSSFRGMLHDQSATGSTLFIEPAAIVKLNNDIRQLELKEQEEIDKILAGNSAYIQSKIPANTYTGQDKETKTFGVKCLIIVSADMDEALVYDLCKAMNEHTAEMAAGNALLSEMTDPSFLCTNVSIPLHAGAEKYYSELGLI